MKKEERNQLENRTKTAKEYERWVNSTFEYWNERISQYPEAAMPELKHQIMALETQIEERTKQLRESINNPYENYSYKIDSQLFLDAYKKLLDRFNSLYQHEQLSIEQKIEMWINTSIPNSPNKKAYQKIFQIICEEPDPKNCTITHLINEIHKKYDPPIGDDMLRKILPKFINSLPL